MAWKTLSLKQDQIDSFKAALQTLSVGSLNPEAILDMTLSQQQDMVNITKGMISELLSGKLQYQTGNSHQFIKEIIAENTAKRNVSNQVTTS